MRILSIDGGGIRGIIPATVLVEVEAILQREHGPDARLSEHFDLFAGTSTGGLLTSLMLLPEDRGRDDGDEPRRPAFSAVEILQFYLDQASTLFRRTWRDRITRFGALAGARYGPAGFNAVLDAALGPRRQPGSELMLSDLLGPTVIPTYNVTTAQPYFFKQHRALEPGGRDFTVRHAALATASAPTYFEPVLVSAAGEEFGACVDGGLFANNPTLCAYAEAQEHFGIGAADLAILSLGTGSAPETFTHGEVEGWGIGSWVSPLIDMMLSGSDHIVDHQIGQILGSVGPVDDRYLRLQADLTDEAPDVVEMDNARPANLRRLVEIGEAVSRDHHDALERFVHEKVLGSPVPDPADDDRPGRHRLSMAARVSGPTGPAPGALDRLKVRGLAWMRRRNFESVNNSGIEDFRRRRMPTSGMPHLVRACGKYPHMAWLPPELMVPDAIPPEAEIPTGYKLRYYGLARLGFSAYNRFPIPPDVVWDPADDTNDVFPPTGDGWHDPTSDESFTRLRLQGPDPWLLRRVEDGTGPDGRAEPTFALDFTDVFAGVLPPVVARFAVRDGALAPTEISVGPRTHRPGDPTWDRAKRVVNAADARYVVFGRHLLETHLIVGAAFALAAYSLPPWHRLRPFMAFFTYGTLVVNDFAYQSLVTEGSYFIESGFATVEDAGRLFANLVPRFDLDRWNALEDIADRGLDAIPDHPYVHDARLVWPAFVDVVERHLDDLRLDDEAIAADAELATWYLTVTKILPGADARDRPLDRARLAELCTALLWNNVVHEICGDFSPIAGSDVPEDKATLNLAKLKAAVADGDLSRPIEPPSMADVMLMEQGSFSSRFNVGGNNIVRINAAREVDDPKLRLAVEDLQATLDRLEKELVAVNEARAVRFARMLPRHWEASISF